MAEYLWHTRRRAIDECGRLPTAVDLPTIVSAASTTLLDKSGGFEACSAALLALTAVCNSLTHNPDLGEAVMRAQVLEKIGSAPLAQVPAFWQLLL